MKHPFFAGLLLGTLMLMPAALCSFASPRSPQQAPSTKPSQSGSASAKDAVPFPQVPRITAEEVERLAKDSGNVVFVDTDDPEEISQLILSLGSKAGETKYTFDGKVVPQEFLWEGIAPRLIQIYDSISRRRL